MIRTRVRAALLAAVLGAALVGCSRGSSIPRSEYVQRVNALCRETTAEIDRSLRPVIEGYVARLGDGPPTDDEVMGLYAATLPVARELNPTFEKMLADLRSLPTPDADADAFRLHWERVEALWDEAFADLATASTNPEAARSLLAEPHPRLAPTNSEAVELGIGECVFD